MLLGSVKRSVVNCAGGQSQQNSSSPQTPGSTLDKKNVIICIKKILHLIKVCKS